MIVGMNSAGLRSIVISIVIVFHVKFIDLIPNIIKLIFKVTYAENIDATICYRFYAYHDILLLLIVYQ